MSLASESIVAIEAALDRHDLQALTSALDGLPPTSGPEVVALAGLTHRLLGAGLIDKWERTELVAFFVESQVDPQSLSAEQVAVIRGRLLAAIGNQHWIVRASLRAS